MRVKASLASFSGSLELGLLRGFGLGEQACHGRSVGALYGNGASIELLLRSGFGCYPTGGMASVPLCNSFWCGFKCGRARQVWAQGLNPRSCGL